MWFRGTKPRRPKPRPAARCNCPPEVTSAFRRAPGRMAASRARGKFGHPPYGLLLPFGVAFIFEHMTRFIWGAQGLPVTIPAFLAQPLSSEFFFITGYRLFMVGMVIVSVTLLFVLLRYTRLGIRIRAGTLDLETVSALGVNVRMLRSLNFAVGIFLAGLSGVLAAAPLRP